MHRLISIAADLGVAVRSATITPGLLGFYDRPTKSIYLSRRLTQVEARCTLAHELGHAYYDHDCSTARTEDQANEYACQLLIDAESYARAERISPYVEDVADELGVTETMVRNYQRFALQRLGLRTYARPPRRQLA
ncbi:ImmA/IrrE family metallo-endopeptidase [Leucobacter luti]|uniref:ImmA/IrrE family metallo-endopeptidase n=1 Tax=Leucobacter luti TaxID=340320 RepID=UPI003D03810D